MVKKNIKRESPMTKESECGCGDPNCYAGKHGFEAMAQKEAEFIEKYGWYVHFIDDDPNMPLGVNFHTHGVSETFKHRDFQIVLPLQSGVAHTVFAEVVDRVNKGEIFEHNEATDDVIGNDFKVKFVNALDGDRRVLRIILPDSSGSLDPEQMVEGYSHQYEGCYNANQD